MQKNRKLIYIILLICGFILVAIALYLITPSIKKIIIDRSTLDHYDPEGIPDRDSSLFVSQGWDKIPEFDSLLLLASDQNGGSIERVTSHLNNNNVYARITTLNDYNDKLVSYFVYDQDLGWTNIDGDKVPPLIRRSLDEKAQTPPSLPDQSVSPE